MVAGPFTEIDQPHARVPVWYYTLPGREEDGERAFGKTPRMIDVFETRDRRAVPVRAVFADRRRRVHLRRHGKHVSHHADRPRLATTSERTWIFQPSFSFPTNSRTNGSAIWSPVATGLRPGSTKVSRPTSKRCGRGRQGLGRIRLRDLSDRPALPRRRRRRYRRPIVCNVFRDPIELFDRHLYEKGAAVLHMLPRRVGLAAHAAFAGAICHENARRTVETIDLIRAIETETGRNTRAFFAQWVERGGTSRNRGVLSLGCRALRRAADGHPEAAH